jgi:predicted nucleotidyltransferase component of viral defense system
VGGDVLNFSREALLAESESTGFRPEILEKVFHLIALLNGFNSHPFLKDRLALKGGTALNLFLFNLPRLSVDIDLNYIGASDLETALFERPRIEVAIRAVATREGLVIRRVTDEHAAITFFLRYESVFGQGGDLKVDLNFMFRVPLWPVTRLNSRRIGTYQAKDFPVIDIHELAAGKLAALFARRAGRDLFDAHALLRSGELDHQNLRLAFIVYGAANRKDWRDVHLSDLTFSERELKSELGPLLRREAWTGPDATKHWGEMVNDETKKALTLLLMFTASEKDFLDRLLDYGEIAPLLLTEDMEFAERIRRQPALEWKAKNVREFKTRR